MTQQKHITKLKEDLNIVELRVGDTVIWRGGWGSDAPQKAKIIGLYKCKEAGDKYGDEVDSILWVNIEYACVDLDNGHWAYGSQLERI